VADLHNDAEKKGMVILNEMGLDPGIDHMSAMKIIQGVRDRGGFITSFVSYGSGLPEPNIETNPLKYCITWNARNISMSGEAGAQYMEESQIKVLSHHQVFQRTWKVDVEGVGIFEAYPNRDSLIYLDVFNLRKVHTMIRGTLRYPGWSETWNQIIRLGMPNENLKVPGLSDMTYREFTSMFLPVHSNGGKLETRIANFLNISPTGKIMENLQWLGLMDDVKIGGDVKTPAEVLTKILIEKMPLPEGARDMVALVHDIEAVFPEENDRTEKIISTFVEYGEPNGFTAISKTVGLPAAIATKLLMKNDLPIVGCQIPTNKIVYTKVLKELEELGLKFTEKIVSS
jgi:saccharopine dehydrogenase-like NADP-dependent oxidoreductase